MDRAVCYVFDVRAELTVAAFLILGCQGAKVDGGPCKYEPVQGPCTIVGAESVNDEHVRVMVRTKDGVELRDTVAVARDRQEGFLAKTQPGAEVGCGGQRIVSGTCSPHEFHLELPAAQDAAEGSEAGGGHGPGMHAMHGGGHGHRAKSMHHRFENAEEWAAVFDDPERDAWQKPDALIASLNLATDAVVADIGAGTGYFAMRFATAVPDGEVLATDIEPDMVRYLSERARKAGLTNLRALKSGADDPALDRNVDVAFLCDVAHHVADRPAFFRRIAQHLEPGGRVVIVDFDPDAPADAPGPPPAMRMAAADLVTELSEAGLVQSDLDNELLPYQYVLELVKPK
jgi:SAM-dependent methyltransferase